MFLNYFCQNLDILYNVWKNNLGFHSNEKTQGQKQPLNNLYFKYQVCQMKSKHLNTYLQFRLFIHESTVHSDLWEPNAAFWNSRPCLQLPDLDLKDPYNGPNDKNPSLLERIHWQKYRQKDRIPRSYRT